MTTLANPENETVRQTTLAAQLAEHPFFKGMNAGQLKLLADTAMPVEWEEGTILFREGDPANRFYVILDGKVAVGSDAEDRGTVEVQTIGPGDVLGWSWLFPPYYWHFNARAVEPTKAIFFYGTRLRERCEDDHDLGYELMKRMSAVAIQRLQATRRRLIEARG